MKTALIFALLVTIAQAQPPGGGPGGGGASGDGIWRRNAAFGEIQTFDSCQGHQPGNGTYHYHVNPLCLRAQLGDNVVLVQNSRIGSFYKEKTSGFTHSPILGWAQDGYPIYGPYGYSDPKNAASPIRRMVSSFSLRNITARTSLPSWSLPNHTGVSQQLTSTQYGPAVGGVYPLGRYLEDFDYVAGSGDLDQYNGRTTVTPDFPNGTYAYFVTIDAAGNPAFPYVLSGQYYGTASGAAVQTVASSATDYFNNGVYTQTPFFAATPILSSWTTANSAKFAQVISGLDPAVGPSTTWPGTAPSGITVSGSVTSPTYAEIQRIRNSAASIYVNTNGLPSYTFGPWFGFQNNGGLFPNFPSSQSLTYQFPATPAPATTLTSTGGGTCGLWVNGVAVFNFIDGASYSNSAGADAGGGIVTPGVINVSAASFEGGPVAPGSYVAGFPLFGAVLASSGSTSSVTVKDSAGTTRTSQVSYASTAQINYLVPAGTATGAATVTVTVGSSTVTGGLNVVATYPNLFAVSQQIGNVLVLYGSGMGSATSATATVGGVNATVNYAGPQGTYPGLDQYNVAIPASMVGKGAVDVVVTVAGLPSNTISVTI